MGGEHGGGILGIAQGLPAAPNSEPLGKSPWGSKGQPVRKPQTFRGVRKRGGVFVVKGGAGCVCVALVAF